MALICSISGVQPEEPCLSKTGYVFERRLIEKHLEDSNTCPATGEPLTISDLIPIKCEKPVKPRPSTASSIPGLLSLFQNEWDALALETYNLRSHVDTVRKQLSYSLYQHDAATRVIARLIKQRDKALQEVESLQQQLLEFKANYDINAIETGIDEDGLVRLQDLAKALMTERKKRDLSGYTDLSKIKEFKLTGEYRTHSSTVPGILSVSLDLWRKSQDPNSNYCFTGGADGAVVYFDLNSGKTASKTTNHVKAVNSVISHPFVPVCVSGSDDKTIRIWKGQENDEFRCSHILKHHKTPVTSLSIHPSGEYILSASADGIWGICDVDAGKVVKICRDISSVCKKVKFHPDGLIAAGAGADGAIHVWDFRQMSTKNSLRSSENSIPVIDVDFSENGYHLASVNEVGILELWDLRKSKTFQTADCNASPQVVKFDGSGKAVAVGSTKVELFHLVDKSAIEPAATFEGHNGYITDLSFGTKSEFLLTTCKDKSLRFFTD